MGLTCAECGRSVPIRVKSRRLCGTCLNRLGGLTPRRKYTSDVCAVETCDLPRRRGHWCIAHGYRVRRYGDPLAEVPIQKRDGVITKTVARGTYRFLWAPTHPLAHGDGYVAEHRLVAWEAGLLTDRADHVHHINHDQLDNRIENLEVLSPAEHRRHHAAEDGTTNQHGWHPPTANECRECGRPAHHGDLCAVHYSRWQRTGDPLGVRRVNRNTIEPYRLITAKRGEQ